MRERLTKSCPATAWWPHKALFLPPPHRTCMYFDSLMPFQTLAALELQTLKPNMYWSAGNLSICSHIGRRSRLCCAQWEAALGDGFPMFWKFTQRKPFKIPPKASNWEKSAVLWFPSLSPSRHSSTAVAFFPSYFLFELVRLFTCRRSSFSVTLTSSSSERCWCRSTFTWCRLWRPRRWRPISCAPSWRTRTQRSRGLNQRYQCASTHSHSFWY